MFGWPKVSMNNDNKTDGNEKLTGTTSPVGTSKKGVELFPAIAERNINFAPSNNEEHNSRLGTEFNTYNPVDFEEALDIVDSLRSRSATTVCLENMQKKDATRLVDFVTGASAAIDGEFVKVTENVYLFCPSNIKISSPETEQKELYGAGGKSTFDSLFALPSLNSPSTDQNKWS